MIPCKLCNRITCVYYNPMSTFRIFYDVLGDCIAIYAAGPLALRGVRGAYTAWRAAGPLALPGVRGAYTAWWTAYSNIMNPFAWGPLSCWYTRCWSFICWGGGVYQRRRGRLWQSIVQGGTGKHPHTAIRRFRPNCRRYTVRWLSYSQFRTTIILPGNWRNIQDTRLLGWISTKMN